MNELDPNGDPGEPAAAGADALVAPPNAADMLNKGMTIGELGVLAAETDLNVANINLVGLADTGVAYI